jgi:hypothetical protein
MARPIAGRLATVTMLGGSALGGCAGGARSAPPAAPTPSATPAPTTSAPAPAGSTGPTGSAASARFAFAPGVAAYDVRTEATIELASGPESERGRESVTSTGRVTYTIAAAGRGLTIGGQIDGFAAQASSRVTGGASDPAVTVRFRGAIDARGAMVEREGPSPACATGTGAAESAAVAAARETVIRMPAALTVGARWRDSVVIAGCRSQLPTTSVVVARYEIMGIEGARVRLRRQSATSLRGQGIAGGRTVTLAGEGAEDATLEVDATRGRLVKVDGEGRATISVTLPDGARQFTQRTKLVVVERRTP